MRKIILTIALSLSAPAFGAGSLMAGDDLKKLLAGDKAAEEEEEKVPEAFKEQKIVVMGKDGKTQGSFDRSKFKIVPRIPKPKAKPKAAEPVLAQTCPPLAPVKVVERTTQITTEKKVFTHNRFRLLGGVGYDGLETRTEGAKDFVIRPNQSFVASGSYDYSFSYDWGLSVEYVTNKTVMGGGFITW